jgi:hypothetical protein
MELQLCVVAAFPRRNWLHVFLLLLLLLRRGLLRLLLLLRLLWGCRLARLC